MILARMAYGNLFLHKAKSLLLGLIICFGIAILFVGNSLIDTTISGLQSMFVSGFTGDLMVTGPTSFPTTIFGETAGGEEVIPHIAKYQDYVEFLKADKRVAGYLPMLSGQVAMGLGEQIIGRGAAFGVNIDEYRNFFSGNIELVAGEWPASGAPPWILISETSAAMLARSGGKKLGPGDKIVLSALGETAGTVIREVTISGIVKFNQSNQQLARISLVDADTLRDLLGFASLRDKAVSLTAEQMEFVTSFNPDALFDDKPAEPKQGAEAQVQETKASVSEIVPTPAWQFLLVKTAKGANTGAVMKSLQKFAISLERNDHVQDWVAGAGTVARTAVTVRLVFNLLIVVIAVIVIMITMNVLVVSISERIPEIGTLRALGAKKRFIRQMILLETTFLTVLAGAVGLLLGFVILQILKRSGIQAPNLFFEALFAGKVLRPVISSGAALKAFAWIFSMSVLSSFYPVAIALRIKPVVAMQGD